MIRDGYFFVLGWVVGLRRAPGGRGGLCSIGLGLERGLEGGLEGGLR